MELADYRTMFFNIQDKNNFFANAISRLKTLDIYKEPLENPKTPVVSNMQGHFMEICATNMHTLSTTMLHSEQKWDIICKKLALQLHHSNKSSFKFSYMACKWYPTK